MERTILVQPTTGGRIEVALPPDASVGSLKMLVAKRLRLHKDKIVLLHRNKQLTEGSLLDNNVEHGSKLTLLPNVETGIMAQNPEQCVMQALETLNDSQVDNFLAGRSPLNLTMRLGDHMMFIQLQLSTVSDSGPTPPTTPTAVNTPGTDFSVSSPLVTAVPPSPPPSPMEGTPLRAQVFTEASRNLTQTLKKLSSSALAKKMKENCNGRCCVARKQGGAVIESMYHHGRGVFSGTFSGTLSPFLQDKDGRPRRNICTVVHILNDLLGASSHCNPCKAQHTATQKQQKDLSKGSDENHVLRAKVERIQALLKQRRQKRRDSPYPRRAEGDSSETAVA